jgi:hypothetical protein
MAQGTKHRRQAGVLGEINPSFYLLGLPKSHPRLGNWLVFAILTGTILALAVFMLGNLISEILQAY